MMKKRFVCGVCHSTCLLPLILAMLFTTSSWAQESLAKPSVDDAHQRFFYSFHDGRSVPDPVLTALQLDSSKVGRSFAIIAGISQYPQLAAEYRQLSPAAADVWKLADYLEKVEFFDEIIVLTNDDVNDDNMRYFLQGYLPDRLQQFPHSRLLIAYSGHGFTYGSSSYALSSAALNLKDRYHSLNLFNLRHSIEVDRPYAEHTLAILNTCNGGAFLNRPFGAGDNDIYEKSAQAITAGTLDQLAWSYPAVGSGSIFFEKVFAALEGRANKFFATPNSPPNLVTTGELFSYVSEQVKSTTGNTQTPMLGDLDPNGSIGTFYIYLFRQDEARRRLI